MGNVTDQLNNGRAHTHHVAAEIVDLWPIRYIWVWGPTGHHAAGRAVDFMTLTDNQRALRTWIGNQIAAYLRQNYQRLGVEYVIWRRRIWNATRSDDRRRVSWLEWRTMEDRGSTTANHMDHVHLSLLNNPPTYVPPGDNDGITPAKDWFDMATEADLQQVVAREIAAQLAPVIQAMAETYDRLVKTPEITWNVRLDAAGQDSTARARDMVAHARSNSFMTHHQFVPLMQAIEALAPTREAQATIRQLTTAAAQPERITDE